MTLFCSKIVRKTKKNYVFRQISNVFEFKKPILYTKTYKKEGKKTHFNLVTTRVKPL
jgi:hypothetical protein